MMRALSFWLKVPVVCLLTLSSLAVQAQYKWVAADGTVSYSDTPPPPEAHQVEKMRLQASTPGALDGLPYTLKRLAIAQPVVLYTQIACAPCDAARSHLKKRGVPYTEQLIKTQADIAAMTKAAGDQSLPTILIGKNRLRGYLASELDAGLDAAGYPKTSMMPPGWQAPPPRSPGAETATKKGGDKSTEKIGDQPDNSKSGKSDASAKPQANSDGALPQTSENPGAPSSMGKAPPPLPSGESPRVQP